MRMLSDLGGVHSQRLRSVATLLEDTDAALRGGARAGAEVWPTGFDRLDDALSGGIRSGDLVLLGGAEGEGKTTFALQVARNAVASGRHAVFFSFEHDGHTLMQRLLAAECATAAEAAGDYVDAAAGVTDIRHALEAVGDERPTLDALLGRLPYGREGLYGIIGYAPNLHIHESNSSTSISEIWAKVSELALAEEPPLVIIDYLQKVPVEGLRIDSDERATVTAESLKDLAMQLGLPVLAIAASDKESLGAGRRMRTRDLRGTSALAYESDIVLILSAKDEVVSREHLIYNLTNAETFRQWTVLTVEKNRSGVDKDEMQFRKDFAHGRFHATGEDIHERLIEGRVFLT